MTQRKKRTPAQMRDTILSLVLSQAEAGKLTGTALTTALNSLQKMAELDKTPVVNEDEERTVGKTIGEISKLPPTRRIKIMAEWRARYEKEIADIDKYTLAAQRELDVAA